MEVKTETSFKSLQISTDLSSQDLLALVAKVDGLGPIGEKVLKIVRELADVVRNIEGATCDLNLIACSVEEGSLTFSVKLEASSQQCSMYTVPTIPVSELHLSRRAGRVLARLGVRTLNQLTQLTEEDLRQQKNCGEVTVDEIRTKLAERQFHLKGE